MPKYMALYMGVMPEGSGNADEDKTMVEKGMAAWGEWGNRNKDAVVDGGGPLGKTRKVSPAGVEPFKNKLTGYTIVEADSLDAAAEMFENHPHFAIFPGDSVEVVEILDMPAM